MNRETISRLIKSGWNKERRIDITEIENKLKERGFIISTKNKEFLCRYANLNFELPSHNTQLEEKSYIHFDTIKVLGKNLFKESLEYLEDEYDFLNVNHLIPVGESANGNLMILCTSENVFYGYTDGCLVKYGENVDEMLDCLIGENRREYFFD